MMTRGPILALDTATATAVIALGEHDGRLVASASWQAGFRHGEELLTRLDVLLAAERVALASLGAIVVGIGPGAFTGLRVGLATAKGLAHGLGRPIVGIPTSTALLAAVGSPPADRALLLPAGHADRVLVHAGTTRILPDGSEPELGAAVGIVAVDLAGRAPTAAIEAGAAAVTGLGAALLRLGAARLAAGDVDDLDRLVPAYVTLPRGVREESGAMEWSRDPR